MGRRAVDQEIVKSHANTPFADRHVQGPLADQVLGEVSNRWLRPLMPDAQVGSIQSDEIEAVAHPFTLIAVAAKLDSTKASRVKMAAAPDHDDEDFPLRGNPRGRGRSERNRKRSRSTRSRGAQGGAVDVTPLHAIPPPQTPAGRRGRGGRTRGGRPRS